MSNQYRRALEASEARFRTLIEKNADGILVVRHNGVVCYVNRAAEQLLGRSAEQLVSSLVGVPVSPGGAAELDIIRGDDVIVAEMRVAELDWEDEPAYLASLRDVTERKRARDALQFLAEASRLLGGSLNAHNILGDVARLAVEHLADCCMIDLIDVDGSVRRLVASCHELSPHERVAPLQGKFSLPGTDDGHASRFIPGQILMLTEISDATLATLALAPEHLAILKTLGCRSALVAPLWSESEATKTLVKRRPIGAITLLDLGTKLRFSTAEQTLARDLAHRTSLALDNVRLLEEYQRAVQRRDEFLAMLAHELRNPLAPILTAAQALKQSTPARSAKEAAAASTIERQARHLIRLVDDLLDVARITHGKVNLRKEIVDLGRVIFDATQSAQSPIAKRKQRFTLSLCPESLYVEADPTRLAQVVSNLLHNASRYTHSGGSIQLLTAVTDTEAILQVRDEGVGIPAEMLTRIFEPFTQVNPSLDRGEGGLGIGLSLVQTIVELHGGQVKAYSEGPNRGSLFEVRLPRLLHPSPEPAEPEIAHASEPLSADRPTNVPPILIVEDNVDAREMLRDLLTLCGYHVELAGDGPEGLQRLENMLPQVVLVDVGLPGMSGYELARKMRETPQGKQAMLIALTGYGRPEDRQRSLEAGFDQHLVKPVDADRLLSLLSEATSKPSSYSAR